MEEFDRLPPQRPSLERLNKLIYQGVAAGVLDALSQHPPSSEAGKIDKAVESNVNKRIEAAQKKSRPSMSSSDSVGSAVGGYVNEAAKKWSGKLKSGTPKTISGLDKEFSDAVDALQSQPGEGRTFHRIADAMIVTLKDMVWIDDAARVVHLKPVLNLARRQGRLVVATLNYDNGIELVTSAHGVVCNTGIDEWSQTGTFDFTSTGVHLIKLHGSIDWTWQRDARGTERMMPHSVIRRIDGATMKNNSNRPAVVFGQRNKLTAEGPFLELLRSFQQELARSQTLTVVGYSFRDPHINTYISQWLNQSPEHRIQIVDPGFETSTVDYVHDLQRLRSTRLEQVRAINVGAGDALKSMYPDEPGNTVLTEDPSQAVLAGEVSIT